MNTWLADTLNGFLVKLGLPIQDWQYTTQLSLQFDGDITNEIDVLEDTLSVCFHIPILPANQTQVLQYLCRQNAVQKHKDHPLQHHWYKDHAVIQVTLPHSDVTEILLEQVYSHLLNSSQFIKAM